MEEAKKKAKMRWFYTAFVLVNLILSCYYVDIWITPNATSRALPVISRYEYHTINIDKYQEFTGDKSLINGHYYSDKAPVSTMIVYPFYVLYKFFGLKDISEEKLKQYPIYIWETVGMKDGRSFQCPKTSPVFIIGDILCGCIPFVLALIISFWALRNQSSKISPVCLSVLPFYGSFLFAYAGTYTGHLLAGFFLFLGYVFLKEKKWYLISGLATGLAFATEYPIGIIFPVWIVLIYLNEKSFKKALFFMAGIAPGILFVLWYNYHITGSWITTSYSYVSNSQYAGQVSNIGFSYPKLKAIWGLLFSTYRGLLFYAPALIVMCWYLIIQNWKSLTNSPKIKLFTTFIKSYFGVTMSFYVLLISANVLWWGGWTYGPRHLIPVTLIALYEGVIYLSKKPFSKAFFYIASGIGILFVWMDKSTKIYMIPEGSGPVFYGNPVFDLIVPDFMKDKFNANTVPTLAFNTSPSFSVYLWPVLFVAGVVVLSWWYAKLNPVVVEPVPVKQKQSPKKFKKK